MACVVCAVCVDTAIAHLQLNVTSMEVVVAPVNYKGNHWILLGLDVQTAAVW